MRLQLPDIYHRLPLSPPILYHPALLIRNPEQHRAWKRRRRMKPNWPPRLRCQLNSTPFEGVYHNLISQMPSFNVNYLQILPSALGLASGIALYLSRLGNKNSFSEIGEWILFTSPTPFNRFVILRCPSITFEGSELSEDVNERLLKEERHFVRLNCGRVQVREVENRDEEKLVYQRVCIGTEEDGGVISLDWPSNLNLEDERGFDTTVVIVPGTVEGSMERSIREFVCECLRRGCFPVVMNPRGCAGSPLTTARLFTAADSDDVSTAIQFIKKARPWTSLMAVGWDYGANMLTKYLAEVGEKTPLTAATCINNPFDLEEATRPSPHNIAYDQKLTGGLIDILRSNKELFQGRAKGFDVEKALSSSSVRDFEKAISMVSYGFDALEDFYAKSSTRHVVGKLKIPVLFIQNDDRAVPLFSVPRSLIAGNPFTSLLLCTCDPPSKHSGARSTLSWCQNVAIEWLTAVELGLLKGRHPLLQDVDITISPSKGLALADGSDSGSRKSEHNRMMNLLMSDPSNGHHLDSFQEMHDDPDTVASISSQPSADLDGVSHLKKKELSQGNHIVLQQSRTVDAEVTEEAGLNSADSDRGEVVKTAEVVVNMLDVTVPDTLTEEQKQKVLTAVGQGESLIKALQGAVPEDVRGKLTNAVSGILQSQNSTLKSNGLMGFGGIPDVTSRLKSKVQEKVTPSDAEGGKEGSHSSGQVIKTDDHGDAPINQPDSDKSSEEGLETEHQASEHKTLNNTDHIQHKKDDGSDSPTLEKELDVLGNNNGGTDDRQKNSQYSDSKDYGPDTGFKPEPSYQPEAKLDTFDGSSTDRYKVMLDDGKNQHDMKDHSNQQNEDKIADSSADKNKTEFSKQMEDKSSHPPSPSEAHMINEEENANQQNEEKIADSSADKNKTTLSCQMEDKSSHSPTSSDAMMDKETSEDQKKDGNSSQPMQNQSSSSSPSFSVSQALDALTGFDDSTQLAVNSVFHVIEDMITQLGDESDKKGEVKDLEDKKLRCAPKENLEHNHHKMELSTTIYSNHADDISSYNPLDSDKAGDDVYQEIERKNHIDEESGHIIYGKQSPEKSVKYFNAISQDSLHISAPLWKKNPQSYLASKAGNTKSLDLDSTTALFLEYFPEEGQYKLLEQTENEDDSIDIATDAEQKHISSQVQDDGGIIEPSYVILDTEKQEVDEEREMLVNNGGIRDKGYGVSISSLKSTILEALKTEIGRRVSATDMQEMKTHLCRDMDHVADAMLLALGDAEVISSMKDTDYSLGEVGFLQGEHITSAISDAILETGYLRRLLPVGVIVGSCLTAVRKCVNATAENKDVQPYKVKSTNHSENDKVLLKEDDKHGLDNLPSENKDVQPHQVKSTNHSENGKVLLKEDNKDRLDISDTYGGKADTNHSNRNAAVVGAVTAALGASALLVHQQDAENVGAPAQSFNKNKGPHEEPNKPEEMPDKTHSNIVASLAEKAMSVAGPVVPTKEDGEVDQERLVSMLAELGQKGGILRLVGKIALLWGGMRGAASLTDKLISFLRIAERPLYQRILAFICMVLVLWSPIVVPLLPALVQSWTTHSSSKIAELSCIIGLYVSVSILIALWGKRIRGYKKPLEPYGLYLNSFAKVNFLKGLIGGVVLVSVIQSLNSILGCVNLHWPSALPSSSLGAVTLLKFYGRLLILITKGFAMATGVSLVEELLFRSWLPVEIAADLGFHRGIIISGIAFALSQRSPLGIPGGFLLSLVLAGARERSKGSLWLPVGLRTGILASSFILQRGGFLTYLPNFPLWITGTHPFQPISGLVGITFCLVLAIILYPTHPRHGKILTRTIRE